jgi:hypothetical protein
MAATPWYLEIIRVSTREKQQDLLTLLREVVSVTALGSSSGPDHFVVFGCQDQQLKTAIEKLFTEVDPGADQTFQTRHSLPDENVGTT